MIRGFWFWVIYCILRTGLFFYHPVFRVIGREHVPKDGAYLICANHISMSDPIWVVLGLGLRHIPRVLAKKEALSYFIIGDLMKKVGVIGIDREGNDVHAIKECIRALRNDQQLLIFPEGTRNKPGMNVKPKRGAMLLAHRTQVPVLPVYVSVKRRPFGPVTCVIGEPYLPEFPDKRPTEQQLETAVRDLMDRIYQMGEEV